MAVDPTVPTCSCTTCPCATYREALEAVAAQSYSVRDRLRSKRLTTIYGIVEKALKEFT